MSAARVGVRKCLSDRGHGSSGQTLILAAFGILAMALSVMATLNLGQAVYEKIKLQSTADSAAYSLATMEARTFNYIAFLNRTQVAHYNTAMLVQSYITWVGFQIGVYQAMVAMFRSLSASALMGMTINCSIPNNPLCPAYSILFTMTSMQVTTFSAALFVIRAAYKAASMVGHWIVEAMSIINRRVIWRTQAYRAVAMSASLLMGMQHYIAKNDPDIGLTGSPLSLLINAAFNSLEYYFAFDKGAGVNPFLPAFLMHLPRIMPGGAYTPPRIMLDRVSMLDPATEAYRVMSAMVSATRTPGFIYNRAGPVSAMLASTPPVFLAGFKMGTTQFSSGIPPIIWPAAAIIPPLVVYDPDEAIPYVDPWTGLADPIPEAGHVAGVFLSSHDYLLYGTGFTSTGLASVSRAGIPIGVGDAIHAFMVPSVGMPTPLTSYHYQGSWVQMAYGPIMAAPESIASGTIALPYMPGPPMFSGMPIMPDLTLRWPGFAPYFKFRASWSRTGDYGQPSTWILINKDPKKLKGKGKSFASKKAPWFHKFSYFFAGDHGSVDTTIGSSRNSFLFEGLTAIARGMVYYHRPNFWGEQPNFFNPFWRARLAPIAQKLQAFWERWIGGIFPASLDAAAMMVFINLLRNALSDIFTSLITAIITH